MERSYYFFNGITAKPFWNLYFWVLYFKPIFFCAGNTIKLWHLSAPICQNLYWRMAIQTNEPEPPLTRNHNKIKCRLLITSFHSDEHNITKTQGWWFIKMKILSSLFSRMSLQTCDTFVCGKHIFWRMSVFLSTQ